MRKYGFDYLVEKASTINEMARPNYWSIISPEFNSEIYLPLLKIVQREGKVDTKHVREKAIEYIGFTLMSNFGKGGNFLTYVTNVTKAGSGKNYTPGFSKWLEDNNWTFSQQKAKEYAIYTLLKKHESSIISPKVKNILLDPANVIEYLDSPSDQKKKVDDEINDYEDIEYIVDKLKKSGKNEYEINQERLKLFLQNRTELTPEDIQYIKQHRFMDKSGMSLDENDIRDLINDQKSEKVDGMVSTGRRIPPNHTAQYHAKRVKALLGGVSRQERDAIFVEIKPFLSELRKLNRLDKKGKLTPRSSASPELEFAENLNDELTHLMSVKINPKLARSKTETLLAKHPQLTDDLLKDLIDLVSSYEEGTSKEQFLNDISKYNSKDISALGNFVVNNANKRLSDNTENASMQYDGYSEEAVARVFDTPEKKKLFDSWYVLSRLEQKDASYAKTSGVASQSDVRMSGVDAEALQRDIDKLELKLDTVTDDDERERIESEIEKLEAKIDELSKMKFSDEEESEESVMGYMTEQVRKDSHLHIHGEYKDRGFKKIKNYAHWTF
jgi:hypothetical protein